ncbi:MAG: hypothetical protein ACRDHP_07480 [Ktedonobacterales bacterium]
MEHGFPLARLARLVADIRTSGRTMRLAVRNTERFGLVHLHFVRGRLTQVEGHSGSPLASLGNLAGWRYGVVRQDLTFEPPAQVTADPQLDAALDETLRRLMLDGVVRQVSLPAAWPSTPAPQRPGSPFPERISPPLPLPLPLPTSPGSGSLPPLSQVDADRRHSGALAMGGTATTAARTDALTTPQWQMVALVVHQVVEGAGALAGAQMAEGFLRQALASAARTHPALHELTLDTGGWLKTREDGAITHYSTYDVADAIAALFTGFEVRCASLLGAERTQDVILVAAAPFRNALAQIGLDFSA